MKNFLLVLFGLTLFSCASKWSDLSTIDPNTGREKAVLRQSIVNGAEPLSESAIQKLLSSRVILPSKINLAIVRLSDSQGGLDFQTIDKDSAAKFYDKSNWGPRVQGIIPVPQVMVPQPATLSGLRQAAALLQADALLIVKPASYGDWKFEWFDKDKAKATTSLEVLLLDTRTSAVPFTGLITESAELSSKDSDYSTYELSSRAKKASENKALTQVPTAVAGFLAR